MTKANKNKEANLSLERVKELLNYNPETGKFVWIAKSSPKANFIKVGDVAGSLMQNGYLTIMLDREAFLAHRLVWFMTYGKFPDGVVDHRDMNRSNNKVKNLRECSQVENQKNVKKRSDNTSGFKGVSFHKVTGKYQARAMLKGKSYYLGLFLTKEEAVKVVNIFHQHHHGEFYRDTTKDVKI